MAVVSGAITLEDAEISQIVAGLYLEGQWLRRELGRARAEANGLREELGALRAALVEAPAPTSPARHDREDNGS